MLNLMYQSGPPAGAGGGGARGGGGGGGVDLADVPVTEVLDESDALGAREAREVAPELGHVAQHQRVRVEHKQTPRCARFTLGLRRWRAGLRLHVTLAPVILELVPGQVNVAVAVAWRLSRRRSGSRRAGSGAQDVGHEQLQDAERAAVVATVARHARHLRRVPFGLVERHSEFCSEYAWPFKQ